MPFAQRLLAVQRAGLLAITFGVPVAFWLTAFDPVQSVKAALVLAALVLAAGAGVARTLATGRVTVPVAPLLWAVVAFLLALAVATAISDIPTVSLPGVYRRFTGTVLYAAYALAALLVVRVWEGGAVVRLAVAMLAAGALAVGYGLVQWAGMDPLAWNRPYGDAVFSTLGNPNFASGYYGMVVPLAAAGALLRRWTPLTRGLCGVLAAAALVAAWQTRSVQGLVAGAAGLGVAALAAILTLKGRSRRMGIVAWLSAAGVALLATVAGLAFHVGPVAAIIARGTLELRVFYWRSALAMFADHPVTGVGTSLFGEYYRAYRPVQAALALDLAQSADDPHNVMLAMFANGGVLLGAAYLAVVAVTGWALVRGLRRLKGPDLLLLGGLGGAWVAYQTQSLVSIDVPPLAATHWVLVGAIAALAAPGELRLLAVPGLLAVPSRAGRKGGGRPPGAGPKGRGRRPPPGAGRGRRPPPVGRRTPTWTTRERVATGAGLLAGVAGLWALSIPLRADLHAGQARKLVAGGATAAALGELAAATGLAPWQPVYWFERGKVLQDAGRNAEALEAFEAAAARNPRDLGAVVTAARTSHGLQRPQQAAAWYRRALRLEPKDPELTVEVARFHVAQGDAGQARALLRRALAVDPANEPARQLLASLPAR